MPETDPLLGKHRKTLLWAGFFVLVLGLAAGLAVGGWDLLQTRRAVSPAAVGADNPALSLPGGFKPLPRPLSLADAVVSDGAGHLVPLANFRGKAVLLNLWATWCPPCVAEMPSLDRLAAQLNGPDFIVLTIASHEPQPEKPAAFFAGHGIKNLPLLIDRMGVIDRVFPIAALPVSLLLDRQGRAVARFDGANHWDAPEIVAYLRHFSAADFAPVGE